VNQSALILIDANVFMYAAGAEHPHKQPSVRFLERVAVGEVVAAVDAEVLQEILHRYRALGRWHDGRRLYDQVRRLVPMVLPIASEVTDRARELLDDDAELTARDALHAAAVQVYEAQALVSFDRDFDRLEGVERRQPG